MEEGGGGWRRWRVEVKEGGGGEVCRKDVMSVHEGVGVQVCLL